MSLVEGLRSLSHLPPSWESLASYIQNYSGRTQLLRLIHISQTVPTLEEEATRLILDHLKKETFDAELFRKMRGNLLRLRPDEPVDSWDVEAEKKANAIKDKLEVELKAYKNNLIKESIRMGHQDLAIHYEKMGDMDNAMRALVRNRDYCTTTQTIFQVNFRILNLSILIGQWIQVQSYLTKIESLSQTKEQGETDNLLHAATGLSLLSQAKYQEAAERFMSISPTIGSSYNQIISMNDIANFTCVLALATFSRPEINKLLSLPSFSPFLELEGTARAMLESYQRSQYAECLQLVGTVKADMILDVYFASHVDKIFESINERLYVQYMKAYNCVSLSKMARSFALDEDKIEEIVVSLLQDGKISDVRLDLKRRVLIHLKPDFRSKSYANVIEMTRKYKEEVQCIIFQQAVGKAGLKVDPIVKAPKRAEVDSPEELPESEMMEFL